ncbi:LPD7 domain-containing protein [Legionella genomosp. 1]|uniref:LPD7 domain-containing protein n=1 Tax=Legionella genomosp. 1 TaxID=1093625 RepID=UPI0021CAE8AA|nr:LPD7 domain-containing protein [Legionella genomosp. 1]
MHQNKTWADWLQQKAQQGDTEAITALRYRNRKKQSNYALSGISPDISLTIIERIDSITKEGTEIYRLDKAVIRNSGNEIKVSKGGSIAILKKAIEMAKQQYGNCIHINGSPLFKKIILQITVQNNISITFADPEMEAQHQKMSLEQGKHHEQSKRYGFNDGRRTSRGADVAGTTLGERKAIETFLPQQSPTLSALDKAHQPKVKTACETCPNSIWFSSPEEVKCYCRIMHMISWSGKDSNLITMCDGKFLA